MTTKTKRTAKRQVDREAIVTDREAIINDAPKLHADFPVGSVAHQGDVILVAIEKLPKSAEPRANRQVADGNTQGARHILTRGDLYDCDKEQVAKAIKAATKCEVDARYVGPVFVSPECPTENDLEHPEHGNQGFPGGCVVAVVYQRNLDQLEREQRTLD